jgi:hypothetical protein
LGSRADYADIKRDPLPEPIFNPKVHEKTPKMLFGQATVEETMEEINRDKVPGTVQRLWRLAYRQVTANSLHLQAEIPWKGGTEMVLWQGTMYQDDRVFILDLQLATKGDRKVWAVTTRRNVVGFPPLRVDDFETREKAIEFIQRIEPTTPRISFGGKPPENPVSYDEYVLKLHEEGIPSAMEIHDMNSGGRGELIISEVAEDELRNS